MASTKQSLQNRPTKIIGRPWRVFIIDDHPLFRAGFRELLEGEPNVEICGEADDEESGFSRATTSKPDLVTVDISLASGNGLSLLSRIKRAIPNASVLVVSMHDDRIYAERALTAGSAGYVCKQSTNDEIINAIRTVRNGNIYVPGGMMQSALGRKVGQKSFETASTIEELSDRELAVFTLIGKGRATQEIANQLQIAISTVDTYRERLKTKLKLNSGTDLARHAFLWVADNS